MTPRTPSQPSNMEVETLCFGGVFSAEGTGQLHRIKGTMDRAIYHQGTPVKFDHIMFIYIVLYAIDSLNSLLHLCVNLC